MRSLIPRFHFHSIQRDTSQSISLSISFKGRREIVVLSNITTALKFDDRSQRFRISRGNEVECIRCNKAINESYEKVINIISKFSSDGSPYTVDDVISAYKSTERFFKRDSLLLTDLVERLGEERLIKESTLSIYDENLNALSLYLGKEKKQLCTSDVLSLNPYKFIKHFKTCKNSTILKRIKCYCGLLRFAVDCGLLSSEDIGKCMLFDKKINWSHILPVKFTHKAINYEMFHYIEAYIFRNYLIGEFDGSYTLKEGVEEMLDKRYTKVFVLFLFIIGYRLQGLAMVDLIQIKHRNIEFVNNNNGTQYLRINDIYRQKTGQYVPIVVEYSGFVKALLYHFIENRVGEQDYLFPVINSTFDGGERIFRIRLNEYRYMFNCKLKDIIKDINAFFSEQYKDQDDIVWKNLPTDITYYSCRHSFATHYMEGGGNPAHLATLMGRSVNNISTYIAELNGDEAIIKEREKAFKYKY